MPQKCENCYFSTFVEITRLGDHALQKYFLTPPIKINVKSTFSKNKLGPEIHTLDFLSFLIFHF